MHIARCKGFDQLWISQWGTRRKILILFAFNLKDRLQCLTRTLYVSELGA
jgi:hypothetical protein